MQALDVRLWREYQVPGPEPARDLDAKDSGAAGEREPFLGQGGEQVHRDDRPRPDQRGERGQPYERTPLASGARSACAQPRRV